MKEHYKNDLKQWYKNDEVILTIPYKNLVVIEKVLIKNKYNRISNNFGIKYIKFNNEQIIICDLKKCLEFLNKHIINMLHII